MSYIKAGIGALVGKLLAALFIAICAAFGFGPDKWAAFLVKGLPTWITPIKVRIAFLILASLVFYLLLANLRKEVNAKGDLGNQMGSRSPTRKPGPTVKQSNTDKTGDNGSTLVAGLKPVLPDRSGRPRQRSIYDRRTDRILFVRIGYMRYYNGLQPGDERTIGGGAFVDEHNWGFELYNFKVSNGMIYGYAQPFFIDLTRDATFNLKRIDPNAGTADFLEDVLVIFIARKPTGGQVIVGWYESARVFQRPQPAEPQLGRPNPRGSDKSHIEFYMIAHRKDAILLPEAERTFRIPVGRGYMGMANVFYQYENNGQLKPAKSVEWVENVLKFINEYNNGNLLDDTR